MDKKISELGNGLCLYKRPDGTVYMAAPDEKKKAADRDEVTSIFGDSQDE